MKNDIEWTDKNLLQSMTKAMDFGLSIYDKDYNIIYQNDILKDIFGGFGKKCFSVYEGRKKIFKECPVKNVFKDGNTHTSIRKVTMPSGEVRYWDNTATPIRNAQGNIVACLEIARDITKRKKVETELVDTKEKLINKSIELEETNTTLKILLERVEINKKDHESRILTNIRILIMPYLERLKLCSSSPEQLNYISIMESNLMEIVSSLSTQLSSFIYSLTPKEIEISNLIKEGKQSKEIAEIMKASFETVNCHRQNIRKKLGLNNSKVNLRAFILSLSE